MNADLRSDDAVAVNALAAMLRERGARDFPTGWEASQIAKQWGVTVNGYKGRTNLWNLATLILQRLPEVP